MDPPLKFYRVGEIVNHMSISRHTVHMYTVMGLIREAEWTPGGHRLYDESVFDRIETIRALNKSGFPLRAIRELFIQGGTSLKKD